jgi:hypothetical protein
MVVVQERLAELKLVESQEPKFILDACSAYRMMWFSKKQPNTVFLDCRSDEKLIFDANQFAENRGRPMVKNWKETTATNPTVEGDYRKLSYPDNHFKLIVFDPPHLINQWLSPKFQLGLNFGTLQAETWPSDIKLAAHELWRCLAPYGVLIFKWSDHDINYKKVLRLFPVKPLFGQVCVRRKTKHGITHTFWFTFMKIPQFNSSAKSEVSK